MGRFYKVTLVCVLVYTASATKAGGDLIFKNNFEFLCGVPSQLGPWENHPLFGSNFSAVEYINDSGLDDVIAAAPAVNEQISGLSINVTGAIVHNYIFPNDQVFWMADGNGSIRTFLNNAVSPSPLPGDSVSFTVTDLSNYFGELHITGLSNWSINSTGNNVLIRNGQDVELVDSTQGYTYQAYGKILSMIGACGTGTTCWNFEHGTEVSELRIRDDVGVMVNSCLHVIAPVYYFEDNALFDIQDWDWKSFY